MKTIIKIQKIIAFLVLLFLFLYIIFAVYNAKMIEKNPAFTIAVIIDKKTDDNSYFLVYKYEVDSVFYEGLCTHPFHSTSFSKFYGKKLLVAYNKKKPQYSTLLINKQSYKIYNLVFPDTLSWLLEAN